MMCTLTIATEAGITGSADCPPAFTRSSSLGPLGLWCCAVSSPAAAPRLDSITHTCKPLTRSLNRHHVSVPTRHPTTAPAAVAAAPTSADGGPRGRLGNGGTCTASA